MLVKTNTDLLQLKKWLRSLNEVTIDIETNITDSLYNRYATLIAFHNNGTSYLIDARKFKDSQIAGVLKICSDKLVIGFNVKFDVKVLTNCYGVTFNKLYDVYLAANIIECGQADFVRKRNKAGKLEEKFVQRKFSLEEVTRRYVDPYAYSEQGNLFIPYVTKKVRESFGTSEEFTDEQLAYAELDVVYTEALYRKFKKLSKELELEKAIEHDNRFLHVVIHMESIGIPFNFEAWENLAAKNLRRFEKLTEKLVAVAPINWSSSRQVHKVLEERGIDPKVVDRDTLEIKDSVAQPVLKRYAEDGLVKTYIEWKEVEKLVNTYGVKFLSYVDPFTLRIHSRYQQVMKTGRTSSAGPNLQNIPRSKEFRECFEATGIFVQSDYSSQEVRIIADKSGEEVLLNGFKQGVDAHVAVARILFDDPSIVKADPRRQLAKDIQFTMLYGGGPKKIANRSGVTLEQARKTVDSYFSRLPKIKTYLDGIENFALEHGYVPINEVTQRKSFLPQWERYKQAIEHVNYFKARGWDPHPRIANIARKYAADMKRVAYNYPIQGTAADMSKEAGIMLLDYDFLEIVLLVHDEWVVHTDPANEAKAKEALQYCMEEASKKFLTLLTATADPEVTKHWKK